MKKEKIGIFDICIYLFMFVMSIAILYPLLHVVATSFSGAGYIARGEVGIFPKGFTIEAYQYILRTNTIVRAYGNTILYTAVGTACNLLMTAVMAYPLSRKNLVGKNVMIKLILFTMFFNPGTIPNYLIVKSTGLIDSMWSLILPNVIWTMNLLIFISFLRGIPESLFESAKLDGASEYTILFRIVLPLSKASLASVGLFYFMGHWNSYFLPSIYLNTAAKYPVQIILKNMLLEQSTKTSSSAATGGLTPDSIKNAAIFVTMIPVIIIYPLVQKYFVSGVMIGSIKG